MIPAPPRCRSAPPPCQLEHAGGRRRRAEYRLTYKGTAARWLVCAIHAEEYRGNGEFLVERLGVEG